jgi:hypothetical protein
VQRRLLLYAVVLAAAGLTRANFVACGVDDFVRTVELYDDTERPGATKQ